jgi:hypothetical protein
MDRLCVPLKLRQQRLGHSDPALTLGVYTHVASEDDLRFVEQLDVVLHGKSGSEEKVQTDAILRPNAPKKENGSGVEPPKPFRIN